MVIFNILVFTSFTLLMFALIVVQVYLITDLVKLLTRGMDFASLMCLIGIIGTGLATIALVIGVTSMLFTGLA